MVVQISVVEYIVFTMVFWGGQLAWLASSLVKYVRYGNLTEPAPQLSEKCHLANHYTYGSWYGSIANRTTQTTLVDVSYHLRISGNDPY